MILTHFVMFKFLKGASVSESEPEPPAIAETSATPGWVRTWGDKPTRTRDDIDAILEAAEMPPEIETGIPERAQAKALEARRLTRNIRAIQGELSTLRARLEAAQAQSVRSEINRLELEIQAEAAALEAAQIDDENSAIALILGMVL